MTKRLVVIRDEGGDWEGIYVDGVLQSEGHSLTLDTFAACAEVEFDDAYTNLESQGLSRLPK